MGRKKLSETTKSTRQTVRQKLLNNQAKLLKFLESWFKDNKLLPEIDYVSKKFGISRSTVKTSFNSFQKQGYVKDVAVIPKRAEAASLRPGDWKVLSYLQEISDFPTPSLKDLAVAVDFSVSFVVQSINRLKAEGYLYQAFNKNIQTPKSDDIQPHWKLTGVQEKLLWYLERELEVSPKMPTLLGLAEKTGHSISTINHALEQLIKKGYIRKTKTSKGKFIEILHRLNDEDLLEVPIVGTVVDGYPMLYKEPVGTIKVNPALAAGRELFGLRVFEPEDNDAVLVFYKWQAPCDANIILAEHNNILILSKFKSTKTEILLSVREDHCRIPSRDAPLEYRKISPDDSLRTIGILLSDFKNGEYEYQ